MIRSRRQTPRLYDLLAYGHPDRDLHFCRVPILWTLLDVVEVER